MNTFEILEQELIIQAADGNTFTAHFTLPEDFPPFDGHFPDFKLLPGVAQVSVVTAAMRKLYGEQVQLQEIQRLKLTNPALPGMLLEISGKLAFTEDALCTVQVRLTGRDKQISTMKLLYKCK